VRRKLTHQNTVKYRQRKIFDAFRWTGDRTALRAWIASLPVPIKIHDCGSTGDHLAGPDVLFNWIALDADPKDTLDQPERVYGDRIEHGQWIVLHEKTTWAKGKALVGISYTDEEFRASFEEVITSTEGTSLVPRAESSGGSE
jgi:hypothetical protein